jgi:diketogulonate reductase-like aldo/keto reductase
MRVVILASLVLVVQTTPTTNTVKLNNGVQMPILAFGAQVWDPATCKSATGSALAAGFRFIWSSTLVGEDCQKAQWEAIKASPVEQDDIFVAGTVNSGSCSGTDDCYSQTKAQAESQFQILPKEPLDMLMLDYPSSQTGCAGVLGQWKAFEELYASKKVRTIAVSNFSPEQLKCISANSSATIPSVNQMPYSVGHGTDTVVTDDGALGVFVQAYSPLGSGGLASDPMLKKIGTAHKKSAVQVALRWIVQRNVTITTQSTNPSHLEDDVKIFDFELTDDEMAQLNQRSAAAAIVV